MPTNVPVQDVDPPANSFPSGGGSAPPPSGGSAPSGGGAAPSGGGASGGGAPASAASVAPAITKYPAVTVIPVRPTLANTPTPGPGHRIPEGASVEITPDPSNAGNAQVARDIYSVLNGPRETFAPNTPARRYIGVRNTNEFWISVANANEGVVIRIYGDGK